MIFIKNLLPTELLEKGKHLKRIPSNELAWDYETLLAIADILKKHSYFILKCTVFSYEDGIDSEEDEWFYRGDDPALSIADCLSFVKDYHINHGDSYHYVINISEKKMSTLRFSKYDIKYRNELGHYLRDDWTSIGDIGKVREGVLVTLEEYERIENAYINVLREVALTLSITTFEISYLDSLDFDTSTYDFKIEVGASLTLDQALILSRHTLRDEMWCKLVNPRLQFHFGYDDYAYLYFDGDKERVKAIIKKHRLFWEDRESPYL
ncbi:hypothetical protein ACVV62_00775 [Streptococcus pluranimalium]